MNIFCGKLACINFFPLIIFPCANVFFCKSPASPHKFYNGSSLRLNKLFYRGHDHFRFSNFVETNK